MPSRLLACERAGTGTEYASRMAGGLWIDDEEKKVIEL